MKNRIVWVLFMLPIYSLAQNFNTLLIPDSLRKDANVVKRFEEIVLEIKSPGKAVQKKRKVYTILNEEANSHARLFTFYNKFNSIDYVTGALYDLLGKEQKKIKKKDLEDFSYSDGFSLMNDTRFKTYEFYCRNYPYTVDFEEEDDVDGILDFDDWFPAQEAGMAVQYSKYVIIAPKDYVIRYKPIHSNLQPVITEDKSTKTYTWEIQNIPAKFTEPMGPSWSEIAPRVIIGPSDFEAEGYKGNMDSWQNYGKFIYELAKGRNLLPDETKRKVHELTDNLKDPRQKISVLYEYMQKNTHYISIQLGIGGWQPFDATYVATKKYGDCKALSNFMVALLQEVGINGKVVNIRAGERASPINEDFPSFQFNHVIACVPMNKDTVWLECTSETLPAGYLSGFTANRYAVLIDESGGKLVHTPKYTYKDNLQTRNINATINEEGHLSASIRTIYKAERQDRLEQNINGLSNEKMLQYLKSNISLPTYDIVKFSYIQLKEVIPPSIIETLELTATNYAQVTGKRIFLEPNILTRSTKKIKVDEDRKFDIKLMVESTDIDSISIQIPAGYEPEMVPSDLKLENKFGKYISTVRVSPGNILYYRNFEEYSGRFPPTDYGEFVKFYDTIYKADHAKLVLVKKE